MRDSSKTLETEKISFRRSCQKQFSAVAVAAVGHWPNESLAATARAEASGRKRRTVLNRRKTPRGRKRARGRG